MPGRNMSVLVGELWCGYEKASTLLEYIVWGIAEKYYFCYVRQGDTLSGVVQGYMILITPFQRWSITNLHRYGKEYKKWKARLRETKKILAYLSGNAKVERESEVDKREGEELVRQGIVSTKMQMDVNQLGIC